MLVRRWRLCSSSPGSAWAPPAWSANRLFLSLCFPPLPLLLVQGTPINPADFKTVKKIVLRLVQLFTLLSLFQCGKRGRSSGRTETNFPLWWLQLTFLKTRAHRDMKPFTSCDVPKLVPATKSSCPLRQSQAVHQPL